VKILVSKSNRIPMQNSIECFLQNVKGDVIAYGFNVWGFNITKT
jgi:hypothetical protein